MRRHSELEGFAAPGGRLGEGDRTEGEKLVGADEFWIENGLDGWVLGPAPVNLETSEEVSAARHV